MLSTHRIWRHRIWSNEDGSYTIPRKTSTITHRYVFTEPEEVGDFWTQWTEFVEDSEHHQTCPELPIAAGYDEHYFELFITVAKPSARPGGWTVTVEHSAADLETFEALVRIRKANVILSDKALRAYPSGSIPLSLLEQ